MNWFVRHKWELLVLIIIIVIVVLLFTVPWDVLLYTTSALVTFVFIALVVVIIIIALVGLAGHNIIGLRNR